MKKKEYFIHKTQLLTTQDSTSGNQRYFIAIIPPPQVYDEAHAFKNYFKEKYNSKGALNSPPHITLQPPFQWKEESEGTLIKSIADFRSGRDQIKIELDGFGSFPPRVIFLSLKQNEPLNQLQQELQQFCESKLNLVHTQNDDRPFHPHLTLAFRDLRKEKFFEAWNEFKAKSFTASFTIDSITLLKHDGQAWQPLHHFPFLNRSPID